MNVGLMTCYVDNYGACLQAYALQQAIITGGHNCEIIQYTPYKDIDEISNFSATAEPMGLRLQRAIKHPIQFCIRKADKINQKKRIAKFENFRKEKLFFSKDKYDSWDQLKKNPPLYDAYVCGSDQIWNPVIHRNINVGPYFLDFVPSNKKKIAYAPSIGIQEVPEQCQKDMARLLQGLDVISVREQHGAELIQTIAGINAPVVLDPTLLLSGRSWERVMCPVKITGPYIFCYLFNEHKETYDMVKKIKEKMKLDVVTLPFSLSDIYSKSKKIYDAGPAEFLYLIRNAALVITDSFHATAFSINFNKNFICLLRNRDNEANNMNSRILSILSELNLKDRLVLNENDWENIISEPIDFVPVNDVLKKRRKKDLRFLLNSIGGDSFARIS